MKIENDKKGMYKNHPKISGLLAIEGEQSLVDWLVKRGKKYIAIKMYFSEHINDKTSDFATDDDAFEAWDKVRSRHGISYPIIVYENDLIDGK